MPDTQIYTTSKIKKHLIQIVLNRSNGMFNLSAEAKNLLLTQGYRGSFYNIPRHHPMLIKTVEMLGDRANTDLSKLKISRVLAVNKSYWIIDANGSEMAFGEEQKLPHSSYVSYQVKITNSEFALIVNALLNEPNHIERNSNKLKEDKILHELRTLNFSYFRAPRPPVDHAFFNRDRAITKINTVDIALRLEEMKEDNSKLGYVNGFFDRARRGLLEINVDDGLDKILKLLPASERFNFIKENIQFVKSNLEKNEIANHLSSKNERDDFFALYSSVSSNRVTM